MDSQPGRHRAALTQRETQALDGEIEKAPGETSGHAVEDVAASGGRAEGNGDQDDHQARPRRGNAGMQLGLEQVAAHYAISSVFSSYAEDTELFCYRVRRISYEVYTSGRGRLALGRALSDVKRGF